MAVALKRKPNWTIDECTLLATLVNERKHIIRGKLSPSLTSAMKKECWKSIMQRLNASTIVPRSAEEIEKKWHNILSSSKTELSSHKKSSMGTGGGPPHKSLSPLAEAVQSVLGEDSEVISGIEGGIDSSLISLLQPNEDVCTISTIQLVNDTPRSSMPTFGTATQLLPLSPSIPSPSSLLVQPSHCQPARIWELSTNQQIIEELTIKKLKLEIEYFELKVKKLKRDAEE
ncbi:hypothetical protein ScPMuIL_012038 [Solemya velum]